MYIFSLDMDRYRCIVPILYVSEINIYIHSFIHSLNILSRTFFEISPTFVVPLIPLFPTLLSFVTLHFHRTISLRLSTVLYTFHLILEFVSCKQKSQKLSKTTSEIEHHVPRAFDQFMLHTERWMRQPMHLLE